MESCQWNTGAWARSLELAIHIVSGVLLARAVGRLNRLSIYTVWVAATILSVYLNMEKTKTFVMYVSYVGILPMRLADSACSYSLLYLASIGLVL